jgi:cytochrome c biogenesis protein CcmG, thiol:disulfide interchange protein DsbE
VRRTALLAAIGAALTVQGVFAQPYSGPAQMKETYLKRFEGKTAPPFNLPDLKGKPVKLSDYKGQVVLLNFWYSNCFPCRLETPDLITLYKAYRERGLTVLGINTDPIVMPGDQGATLQKFLDTFQVPYPILMADRKIYEDYGKIPIAPITLLVDRQGTIGKVFWGATHGPAFEGVVRNYLKMPARATGTPAGSAP